MKYCNILLSALATVMTLTGIMPCGACAAGAVRAASLGHIKAIAHRVYEEGLNLGRFEVPYSPGFVGHGSTSTSTHADGMAEVKGFREALPDLKVTVHNTLAERDLAAVHWTARGTSTRHGSWLSSDGSGRAGHRHHSLPNGRWAHCRAMDVRHSHGLMKQLGMLPTPAAGSATGGSPADGTAR